MYRYVDVSTPFLMETRCLDHKIIDSVIFSSIQIQYGVINAEINAITDSKCPRA